MSPPGSIRLPGGDQYMAVKLRSHGVHHGLATYDWRESVSACSLYMYIARIVPERTTF